MKIINKIFIVSGILVISACCPQSKNRTYNEYRFKDDQSFSFIPQLNGSVTFRTDSGKSISFEEVTSSHTFKEYNKCEPEECCHHIENVEAKGLFYYSRQVNVAFNFSMSSGELTDFLSFGMNKYSIGDYSQFTDGLFFVNNIDIKNIFDHSDTNCVYHDTITLRSKAFGDVYEFKGTSIENKKFAESVFYNNRTGIIGFRLNDKSIWTKD